MKYLHQQYLESQADGLEDSQIVSLAWLETKSIGLQGAEQRA